MHLAPLLIVGLLAAPPAGNAALWGVSGHRAIALAAYDLLTPATRVRVNSLLDAGSIADASTWADDIRRDRPKTAPWHYVNVPIEDRAWDAAKYCPADDCVVGAIARFRVTLADTGAPRPDRTEALKFLIHFIGDLHQPLHSGDSHDRGGNDVRVVLAGSASNLHRVWDTDIIRAMRVTDDELTERIRAEIRLLDRPREAAGSVESWVMEAHDVALMNAYTLGADGVLGKEYVAANTPVVVRQLARAAIRLARVLNDALDRSAPAEEGGTRSGASR